LDVSRRDRRQEGRGFLAQSPSADERHGPARAHSHPRGLDEELPPGGALRCARTAARRARRTDAARRAADERQPAHQRRSAAASLELPDFHEYAVDVPQPGAAVAGRRASGRISARRDEAQPRAEELSRLQPRREQLESLAGHPRGHQAQLDGGDSAEDDHLAPTGESWRC
jgi:hypothetical protein